MACACACGYCQWQTRSSGAVYWDSWECVTPTGMPPTPTPTPRDEGELREVEMGSSLALRHVDPAAGFWFWFKPGVWEIGSGDLLGCMYTRRIGTLCFILYEQMLGRVALRRWRPNAGRHNKSYELFRALIDQLRPEFALISESQIRSAHR